MPGFLQRDPFFLVKLCGDLCAHGIAGKNAAEEGKCDNAIQPKQDLGDWLQESADAFCSADLQQDAAGCNEWKKGGKDLCKPDLNAFGRNAQHGIGMTQQCINQKTGAEAVEQFSFFQSITPNKKAEILL